MLPEANIAHSYTLVFDPSVRSPLRIKKGHRKRKTIKVKRRKTRAGQTKPENWQNIEGFKIQ